MVSSSSSSYHNMSASQGTSGSGNKRPTHSSQSRHGGHGGSGSLLPPPTHALPPKPVVASMPFLHPSHPSLIEATAMSRGPPSATSPSAPPGSLSSLSSRVGEVEKKAPGPPRADRGDRKSTSDRKVTGERGERVERGDKERSTRSDRKGERDREARESSERERDSRRGKKPRPGSVESFEYEGGGRERERYDPGGRGSFDAPPSRGERFDSRSGRFPPPQDRYDDAPRDRHDSGREMFEGARGTERIPPQLEWESRLSSQGELYYYNVRTYVSTWDKPVSCCLLLSHLSTYLWRLSMLLICFDMTLHLPFYSLFRFFNITSPDALFL